ncbi:DUF4198 domain-containing protein [Portibacter marinus]|uniref:DUF4198 domain-containing protein n=1 Tax=Portibacter marinus TaxID=2898660 RepID=UPI001F2899A0|nr:DUF4198 domain-containing protein [Portibacter marinus]
MKKLLILIFAFVVLSAHDMFLKLDTYFLQPNSNAVVKLYNGTFQKSENVIARNRMTDVSIVGNGERTRLDTTQWSERDSMTLLSFQTGSEGTYVVGVSTKARNIALAAEDFNSYLEHDGVKDMLAWRKENDAMEDDAVEKYSKHVKAIYQVGNVKSVDWNANLGYPIEFIPLTNPYELHTGDSISVKLLWQGKPLSNQLVYVDSELSAHGHQHAGTDGESTEHVHSDEETHNHEGDEARQHDHNTDQGHSHAEEDNHTHTHDEGHAHSHDDGHTHDAQANGHDHEEAETHSHSEGTQLRTDSDGNVQFKLTSDGIWYLRTIHLTTVDDPELTHESNWATLTFETTHSHEVADHSHEEEQAFGIPSYAYWLGSLAIVGILFFWFYKKGE